MVYILGNGTEYLICDCGGKRITTTQKQATRFPNITKANNVVYHIDKKFKRYNFKPIELDEVMVCKNIGHSEKTIEVELDFEIDEKVSELIEFTANLEQRAIWLSESLRISDLEIEDIQHAAEFYNLNAAQGYKIYKMLREVRIKRRKIKNEMEKIKYILKSNLYSTSLINVEKSIKGIDERQYTPRVIKELFNV